MAESEKKKTVNWSDLLDAYLFVDSANPGESEAFLNLETGEFFYRSESGGDLDESPEDIDDEPEKYLQVPDKRELDLGKRLAIRFVREFLPADIGRAESIFSRRGAYGRFKDMLEDRNALERWYDYENTATETALRAWCGENDVEVVNTPRASPGAATGSKGAGPRAADPAGRISRNDTADAEPRERASQALPVAERIHNFGPTRMRRYDPLAPRSPEEWESIDEAERIQMAEEYHRRARVRLPNAKVHAVFHVIVENQIALGDKTPVRRTMARLMSEGLDRHEAIHAVASVLVNHMHEVFSQAPSERTEDLKPGYYAGLERLTAEDWLESGDE